jgi:lambda repressor-like predicted transcriptional regulator
LPRTSEKRSPTARSKVSVDNRLICSIINPYVLIYEIRLTIMVASPDFDLHRKIKQALHSKGVSLASISRQLGVSRATVTCVCQGYRRSRRVETAIASALEKSPEEIWPDRYLLNKRGWETYEVISSRWQWIKRRCTKAESLAHTV